VDEALARLEREVAQDPSDEARLRALAAAKQRAGWTYAGRGLEHWVGQLSVAVDARDHRTGEAFRAFGIAAVPLLLDALADGSTDGAWVMLFDLGPRAVLVAVPALRRLASSAQGEARRAAHSLLLSRHAPLEAVFDLVEGAMSDPDEEVRLDALYFMALHEPTPPSAIPQLVHALRDPAPLMRRLAARLLSRVVDPRVRQRDVIEALLSQDVSGARAPDEPTFETVAGGDAIPAFVAATSSPEARVRARAIRLLAVQQHGPHREAVAAALEQALSDTDSDVRAEAFEAVRHLVLNGLDPMHFVPAVLAALDDPAPDRRVDAAGALRTVGSAAVAVPALLRALEDSDAQVRRAAGWSLAQRGEAARPALPRLVALLDDPDPEVRHHAELSIEAIGVGADQLPLIERLLQRDDTRILGAQLLAALGAPGVSLAPSVLAWLRDDPREQARGFLADALLAMGRSLEVALAHSRGYPGELSRRLADLLRLDPEVGPTLTRLLDHPSSRIRVAAAQAIGASGPGETALRPLLELLVRGPTPRDRASAAHALGELGRGPASVVAALVRALEDDAPVALAAAGSLEALGDQARSAAPGLERAIASDDSGVSRAARIALDAVTG
jgi:HEAT repeat protein